MFRTIVTSGLALVAAFCAMGAGAEEVDRDRLCPRGTYSIGRGAEGNILRAVVKLPTPGYKVELKADQETAGRAVARLLCTKSSGHFAQVMTTYTATLPIAGMQALVRDGKGQKRVNMASAVPAPKCKSNADCKADGEFCDTTPDCGPKVPGRCVRKPTICTMQFDPVEGCDGKTYSNACKAVSEGVSVKGRASP